MRVLCSWRSHDIDIDASVVTVPRRESSLVPSSVGTRPRWDYTQHVMLNDCIVNRAAMVIRIIRLSYHLVHIRILNTWSDGFYIRWISRSQYPALTPVTFDYKPHSWVSKALDTERQCFFSLLYFCFRTLVSALQHFPLPHATKIILQGQIKTMQTFPVMVINRWFEWKEKLLDLTLKVFRCLIYSAFSPLESCPC